MVLDIAQLRSVTEDDKWMMHQILTQLVSDTSEQIDMLRRAIERADMKQCLTLAHSGIGACAIVGAATMASQFRSLELAASHGDLRLCQSSTEQLFLELEKLRLEATYI